MRLLTNLEIPPRRRSVSLLAKGAPVAMRDVRHSSEFETRSPTAVQREIRPARVASTLGIFEELRVGPLSASSVSVDPAFTTFGEYPPTDGFFVKGER